MIYKAMKLLATRVNDEITDEPMVSIIYFWRNFITTYVYQLSNMKR